MLCEKCKIREANVQIVEIVNGQKTEHFLCAQCAAEMDLNVHSPQGDMSLAKLLSTLLSQTVKSQQKEEPANVVCPTCGTTYEEFINDSKLGCADCYKVFDLLIGENIKQLQGSDRHHGKCPKYISGEIPEQVKEDIEESITGQAPDSELLDKLLDVRKELRAAVAAEEFEKAAVLRDELRTIEEEAAARAVGGQTAVESNGPEEAKTTKRTAVSGQGIDSAADKKDSPGTRKAGTAGKAGSSKESTANKAVGSGNSVGKPSAKSDGRSAVKSAGKAANNEGQAAAKHAGKPSVKGTGKAAIKKDGPPAAKSDRKAAEKRGRTGRSRTVENGADTHEN